MGVSSTGTLSMVQTLSWVCVWGGDIAQGGEFNRHSVHVADTVMDVCVCVRVCVCVCWGRDAAEGSEFNRHCPWCRHCHGCVWGVGGRGGRRLSRG